MNVATLLLVATATGATVYGASRRVEPAPLSQALEVREGASATNDAGTSLTACDAQALGTSDTGSSARTADGGGLQQSLDSGLPPRGYDASSSPAWDGGVRSTSATDEYGDR